MAPVHVIYIQIFLCVHAFWLVLNFYDTFHPRQRAQYIFNFSNYTEYVNGRRKRTVTEAAGESVEGAKTVVKVFEDAKEGNEKLSRKTKGQRTAEQTETKGEKQISEEIGVVIEEIVEGIEETGEIFEGIVEEIEETGEIGEEAAEETIENAGRETEKNAEETKENTGKETEENADETGKNGEGGKREKTKYKKKDHVYATFIVVTEKKQLTLLEERQTITLQAYKTAAENSDSPNTPESSETLETPKIPEPAKIPKASKASGVVKPKQTPQATRLTETKETADISSIFAGAIAEFTSFTKYTSEDILKFVHILSDFIKLNIEFTKDVLIPLTTTISINVNQSMKNQMNDFQNDMQPFQAFVGEAVDTISIETRQKLRKQYETITVLLSGASGRNQVREQILSVHSLKQHKEKYPSDIKNYASLLEQLKIFKETIHDAIVQTKCILLHTDICRYNIFLSLHSQLLAPLRSMKTATNISVLSKIIKCCNDVVVEGKVYQITKDADSFYFSVQKCIESMISVTETLHVENKILLHKCNILLTYNVESGNKRVIILLKKLFRLLLEKNKSAQSNLRKDLNIPAGKNIMEATLNFFQAEERFMNTFLNTSVKLCTPDNDTITRDNYSENDSEQSFNISEQQSKLATLISKLFVRLFYVSLLKNVLKILENMSKRIKAAEKKNGIASSHTHDNKSTSPIDESLLNQLKQAIVNLSAMLSETITLENVQSIIFQSSETFLQILQHYYEVEFYTEKAVTNLEKYAENIEYNGEESENTLLIENFFSVLYFLQKSIQRCMILHCKLQYSFD